MANRKRVFRMYSAWNYERELEVLNRESEKGWQLVKGGCFGSRFVKNPNVRYRYQMDYGRVEDMARYLETYREQGWEYISSTFNGWHYFRKPYDPSLPEESYEIFTDRESLREMRGRWARLALWVSIFLGLMAILCAVRLFLRPHLVVISQLLTFAVECGALLRGALIMRADGASHNRRSDSAWLAVFLAVVALGCTANILLTECRPNYGMNTRTDSLSAPICEMHWDQFTVQYQDSYYLTAEGRSAAPVTLAVADSEGHILFETTGTELKEKNVRLKLPRGVYDLLLTASSGYDLHVTVD